jgi:hypothetical protein
VVTTGPGQSFIFSLKFDTKVPKGSIGFNLPQRKWATLSLNQDIDVRHQYFDPKSPNEFLSGVSLEVDFLQKKQYAQFIKNLIYSSFLFADKNLHHHSVIFFQDISNAI